MLRRGRDLNKISLDFYAKQFMNGKVSTKCPDFMASLKIWDSQPILDVYFDDSDLKESN